MSLASDLESRRRREMEEELARRAAARAAAAPPPQNLRVEMNVPSPAAATQMPRNTLARGGSTIPSNSPDGWVQGFGGAAQQSQSLTGATPVRPHLRPFTPPPPPPPPPPAGAAAEPSPDPDFVFLPP